MHTLEYQILSQFTGYISSFRLPISRIVVHMTSTREDHIDWLYDDHISFHLKPQLLQLHNCGVNVIYSMSLNRYIHGIIAIGQQ